VIRVLFALLLFVPAVAWGQPSPAPPRFFPSTHILMPQQNSVMAWAPYQQVTNTSTTFNVIGTGRTNVQVMELEGDPIAVQVIFHNSTASPYTIAQVTGSPTSQYGTGNGPGTQPYDATATAIFSMVPLTFNNGGRNSLPWSATNTGITGDSNTSGRVVIPLILGGSVASGQSTLTFGTTKWALPQSPMQPTVGMYVTDGKGCIATGTRVSSVNSTQIGIDTPTTGSGCLQNQNIYFSYQPITLSVTVPASSNGTNGPFIYSDWTYLPDIPRIDGGFVPGMSVSCTNCGSNQTVASVGYQSVTMSGSVIGTVASGTAVTFSVSPTTTAAAATNQSWFIVSSTAGIQPGQTVTGSASIPAGTTVTQVGPQAGFVRLSATLTSSVAQNTALTFSNTAYTNAATTSGNVLSFLSTNNKRLYTFRSMGAAGSVNGNSAIITNSNLVQAFEASLGLPYTAMYQSTIGVDGMNVPSTLQNSDGGHGQGGASGFGLIYAVRYITRQRGATVCTYGDSHIAGGGTASGSDSIARLAAARLSTLQRPVSFVNSASGGQTPDVYAPIASQWIANGTCSIIVAQYASRNSNSEADQLSYLGPVMSLAASAGARMLYITDMPRAGTQVVNFTVASAVNASTTVPLKNFSFGSGYLNAGGSGYFITGNGIPANTTFSYAAGGATSITLSQAATLAAGTLLTSGANVPATTTASSTSVTLGQPAVRTFTGYNVTGTNIADATAITITQGSTSATLNKNATGTGATTLTIYNPIPSSETSPMPTLMADAMSVNSPSQPVVDTYFCGMDPANVANWLPQYSQDGIHGNDNWIVDMTDGNAPDARGGNCPAFRGALAAVVGN
jgi:hypothetical protein